MNISSYFQELAFELADDSRDPGWCIWLDADTFTKKEFTSKDLDNFLKYYDDFLEDIFEHVNIGAIKRDDVKDLVKSKEQSVLWDY